MNNGSFGLEKGVAHLVKFFWDPCLCIAQGRGENLHDLVLKKANV